MLKKAFTKERILRLSAILLALAVWQIAAWVLNSRLILVSPIDVAMRLLTIWREDGFFQALMSSFVRITLGFSAGLAAGFVLAVAAGRWRAVEILLRPYMTTIKAVPVASFIIVALFIFSSEFLSLFIAFLMTLPVVYTNLLSGLRSIDRGMLEMADIFRMSWGKRFVYIMLPRVRSHILSACSVSIGLAWKSGIAAEVIGITNGSVGEKLYYTKVYFDTADLFAWTVIIVVLSLVFEKLFTGAVKLLFKGLERIK